MKGNVSSFEEHKAKKFLEQLAKRPFVAIVFEGENVTLFHPAGINPAIVAQLIQAVQSAQEEVG